MMRNGAVCVRTRVIPSAATGSTCTGRRQYQHQQQHQDQQTRGVRVAAIIIGAPGSGKGTISGKILRDFPFAHISTGDLLREEIQAGSTVGRQAKSFMDRGAFVPDDVMISIVVDGVHRAKGSGKHTLLDGFPRSTSQATTLKEYLSIDMVMNLDVPRAIIVERLTDRWIHPASGRVYAYSYRPPKEHGKDDVTGEELVRRNDDKPEVVEERLAKYENTTRPLLDLYNAEGILHSFSGEKSDLIYKDVNAYLSNRLPTEKGGPS